LISWLEEKVNVDERTMSEVTGTPTPCRFRSPAWIARVCGRCGV
jgi:hypothetical protein